MSREMKTYGASRIVDCELALQHFEGELASHDKSDGVGHIYVEIGVLSTNMRDYLAARRADADDPLPARDFPKEKYNKWSGETKLVRGSSYSDPLHQAEHRIAVNAHIMLNHIEDLPGDKTELFKAFRLFADELVNLGIFLDQGATYANKTTMPKLDKKREWVPSEPRGHTALFTRLNKLDSGGHER